MNNNIFKIHVKNWVNLGMKGKVALYCSTHPVLKCYAFTGLLMITYEEWIDEKYKINVVFRNLTQVQQPESVD